MYLELYDNSNLDSITFYANYINSYVEKDVSNLTNLISFFTTFFKILTSTTSEELVYETIEKTIGGNLINNTRPYFCSCFFRCYLISPYNELSIVKTKFNIYTIIAKK